MNYQLIALDMDGTLLDGAKRVRQTSVDAIERALERGRQRRHLLGRLPARTMVEHHRDELPGLRYAICSSGATLFDLVERRVLSSLSFEAAVIEQLRELTSNLDFSPDAFCGRDFFFEVSVFDSMNRYGIARVQRSSSARLARVSATCGRARLRLRASRRSTCTSPTWPAVTPRASACARCPSSSPARTP